MLTNPSPPTSSSEQSPTPSTGPTPDWLTTEQAAAWIGVSRRTMDNLRASGRLDGAYFQTGAVLRYHRDTLRTVMLATSAPATPAELSSVQVAQVLALLAAHRAQAAAPPPPPPPDAPTSTPDDPTSPRRQRREPPGLAALRAGILPPKK